MIQPVSDYHVSALALAILVWLIFNLAHLVMGLSRSPEPPTCNQERDVANDCQASLRHDQPFQTRVIIKKVPDAGTHATAERR